MGLEGIGFNLELVRIIWGILILLFSSHRLDAEGSRFLAADRSTSWQKPKSLNYYEEEIHQLTRNFHITL